MKTSAFNRVRSRGSNAMLILAARQASPATPLFCLFYLPVYREYGEGEPVVRVALRQGMKLMAEQFVMGRTIDEALERSVSADASAQGSVSR